MKVVQTKERILDAAVKVFARQGFHRSRVADVAREANVAYGLVYHYFKSKEELLEHIFQTKWSLFLAALQNIRDDSGSTREKLHKVLCFLFETYRQFPELIQLIILEITRDSRFMKQEHLAQFKRAFEIIREILEDGKKRGEVDEKADLNLSAFVFGGSIEVLLTTFVLGIFPWGEGIEDNMPRLIVDMFMDGIGPKNRQGG